MSGKPRVFYGWYVVAVSFLTLAIAVGLWFSFSVFFVALIEEFGASRGITAGAGAFNSLVSVIVQPFIGRLFDRYNSRLMFFVGAVVLCCGLILSALSRSIWQFYLFYGIIAAFGFMFMGFVPATAIVSNWFKRKVGLALGLAFSGVGFGMAAMAPLSQYLINLWGWRFTMVFLGVMILLILGPLTALVQVYRPEHRGLLPDGDRAETPPASPQSQAQGAAPEVEWTLPLAIRQRHFWYVFCTLFGAGYALQAVLVHHVALLTDLGISKLTAAFFFSVVSFGRMGGQLVWGSVSDRLLRETTYTLSSLCFMLGIVSLMFLDAPPAFVLIYGYTILFGFGSGGMSPITSAMAADLFRGRNFGAIFGTLNMGFQLGAGAGAWLSGVVFDAFNSYQLAFVLAVAAIVMSCSSAWIAAPRRIRKTLVGRLRIG